MKKYLLPIAILFGIISGMIYTMEEDLSPKKKQKTEEIISESDVSKNISKEDELYSRMIEFTTSDKKIFRVSFYMLPKEYVKNFQQGKDAATPIIEAESDLDSKAIQIIFELLTFMPIIEKIDKYTGMKKIFEYLESTDMLKNYLKNHSLIKQQELMEEMFNFLGYLMAPDQVSSAIVFYLKKNRSYLDSKDLLKAFPKAQKLYENYEKTESNIFAADGVFSLDDWIDLINTISCCGPRVSHDQIIVHFVYYFLMEQEVIDLSLLKKITDMSTKGDIIGVLLQMISIERFDINKIVLEGKCPIQYKNFHTDINKADNIIAKKMGIPNGDYYLYANEKKNSVDIAQLSISDIDKYKLFLSNMLFNIQQFFPIAQNIKLFINYKEDIVIDGCIEDYFEH